MAGDATAGVATAVWSVRDMLFAAEPSARELIVKALAARDLVDFDALIELPAALLTAEPDLAAMLRERWQRISVDEYQDMDAAQGRLLRLLAGDGGGLTVIGDPDQAIYGFRGADVNFFLGFAHDYPAATTLQLTRNYRSSAAIVAGALAAIAPATLVPGRKLEASAAGPAISFHEAADELAEAAWIARRVDRLLGGSSFHSLDSGRADAHGHDGLGLSGIAVLYRTDAQAGPIGQAEDLRQMDNPPRTLLAAGHQKMRLVAIQERQKHHARFVKAGWRAENMPRQRNRRR